MCFEIAIQQIVFMSILTVFPLMATAEDHSPLPDSRLKPIATKPLPAERIYHLSPQNTLGELLRHPAFKDYGLLLLPWDGARYRDAMHIADIAELLPYHSQIRPEIVTRGLNRMIDDVTRGQTVFYDLYTLSEKQADPSKAHTGLFFFRGRPGAPFAIISPGGGFSYVGSVHEGFPYAEEISEQGYNAFVLKYRVGQGGRVATEDLARAIAFVVGNATALKVSPRDYSLWGSSAGARMAAAIGSHGPDSYGENLTAKPLAVVMAYTAHEEIACKEPATYVIVGEHDAIAPPSMMERRVEALRRIDTPVKYRRVPELGHGFGTGQGTRAQGWISEAIRFWEAQQNRHGE